MKYALDCLKCLGGKCFRLTEKLLMRIVIVVVVDDKDGKRRVVGDGGKVVGYYEQDEGHGDKDPMRRAMDWLRISKALHGKVSEK